MELRHLQTFRAVARASSFTRAATELGYVQSAVTGHIKALERELGVSLFDRVGRTTALTEAGEHLLGYAERIEDLVREATTALGESTEPGGPVRISAPEMLCAHRLPTMIRHLHRQFPKIRLLMRANPTGAFDAALARALADREVDLAFVLEEQLQVRAPLAAEPLAEEPLLVVVASSHPPCAGTRGVRPPPGRHADVVDRTGVPLSRCPREGSRRRRCPRRHRG